MSGVLLLLLLFLIGLNQRLSARLVIHPLPQLLTLYLFAAMLFLFLFSTTITLVTALTNWLHVIHLQWLSHVLHVRHHLSTITVWKSPIQELISSVMVSPLLFPTCGTLSHLRFFQLPPFLQKAGYHHLRDQMA